MSLDEFRVAIMGELRKRHPGEKLYIPAHDTSKTDAIARAVRTLPTAVVAERFGVTRDWARKVSRRSAKKRD